MITTPKAALELVSHEGILEISSGVYLQSQENILQDKESWDEADPAQAVDLHGTPFWITTNDGVLLPVYGEDDSNLNGAMLRSLFA